MADFAKHDLEMLRYYVGTDNRELYFNYLAQMEGNDGYGTLALGVVRNDNAPGATANHFAQAQGGEKALHLGERGWQKVGEDLIEQDFILREGHFNNQRPDLALNLPVRDVQLPMTEPLRSTTSRTKPGRHANFSKPPAAMAASPRRRRSGR